MVAMWESEAMTMIKHCVDYRTLRGKRDELGCALRDDERELLDELEAFFAERADGPDGVPEFASRSERRRPVRVQVEFRGVDGTVVGGRLENLSGGGAFVETGAPLIAGDRTVLRIFDASGGREFRFGAEVAWVGPSGMGLRFVGIPLEVRLGHRRTFRPLRRAA
jgi:hypothetical protein